jgi:predicted nucleic acid-binding protein
LASNWSLRGADLWHLAAAKTLQCELPELLLLTFDQRLYHAAAGENIACEIN